MDILIHHIFVLKSPHGRSYIHDTSPPSQQFLHYSFANEFVSRNIYAAVAVAGFSFFLSGQIEAHAILSQIKSMIFFENMKKQTYYLNVRTNTSARPHSNM